jgi:hypothetical protein
VSDPEVQHLSLRDRFSTAISMARRGDLYTDSRCAVPHVDHRPFVDSDKAEDYHRLARDIRLVKGLARMAIESMP